MFWEQYLQFINFVQTQIGYVAISPCQIVKNYHAKNEINIFLNCLKNELDFEGNFPRAWVNSVKKTKKELGLTEDDENVVLDFGEKLGSSDIRNQLKHCNMHIKFANDHLKEADCAKKEMSRLYLTLGAATGMGLSLLFM
jgi:stage III sporulation protein AB